eukprot:880377-Amphidinium_carterae.1
MPLGCLPPSMWYTRHAWTDELTREARLAKRSAERGIGPARQSALLPLQLLADVEVADDALCEGVPIAGWPFILVGSFFLLREVELAAAKHTPMCTSMQILPPWIHCKNKAFESLEIPKTQQNGAFRSRENPKTLQSKACESLERALRTPPYYARKVLHFGQVNRASGIVHTTSCQRTMMAHSHADRRTLPNYSIILRCLDNPR